MNLLNQPVIKRTLNLYMSEDLHTKLLKFQDKFNYSTLNSFVVRLLAEACKEIEKDKHSIQLKDKK